jgi:hypothetical protein
MVRNGIGIRNDLRTYILDIIMQRSRRKISLAGKNKTLHFTGHQFPVFFARNFFANN